MTKRKADWPTFRVVSTLIWNPKHVPQAEKEQEDGTITREHAVNRLTAKPVKARDKKHAKTRAHKIWRDLFGKGRVIGFKRSIVTAWLDPWAVPFEERVARKMQRLNRIKANRKKRIRK